MLGLYLGTSPVTAAYRNGVGSFPDWLAELFSNGETGVLFDPSTAGTLYTTTAMTIPATPGDPVGMMLDQSQWGGTSLGSGTVAETLAPIVGPELVTSGSVSADWTLVSNVALSDVGGKVRATASGTNARARLTSGFPTEIGKTYRYVGTYELISGATNNLRSYITDAPAGAVLVVDFGDARTFEEVFVATSTTSYPWIWLSGSAANQVVDFSGMSVKEIPGYHATQATAAKRPTYGIHPFGGRRNLLTYSEDFSNAVWTKSEATISGNTGATADPSGGFTADVLIESTATTGHSARQSQSVTAGVTYTYAGWFKAAGRNYVSIRGSAYNSPASLWWATYSLVDGGIVKDGRVTASATDVGDGWWKLIYTYTAPYTISAGAGGGADGAFRVALSDVSTNPSTTNLAGNSYTGDGTSGIYLWGAQLEQSATATDYQKVTSQYVVTETGVPSVHYLAFDGVDDAMATPSIDFSASDEMSVFAGARKLADAIGMIAELSTVASNLGSFALLVGSSVRYRVISTGSSQVLGDVNSVASPSTDVVTGLYDISADLLKGRINGTETTFAGDQGTGNYGNYPLYIGARAGTELYFNGNLYGLTVRGKTTDDAVVRAVEAVMATKIGVTL
jgi:hypothetical protein